MNLLQRFLGFISRPDHRRTFSILAALAILAAIPLTVYIAQQRQEIRQRASGIPGYQCSTTGDTFDFLDTCNNSCYGGICGPVQVIAPLPSGCDCINGQKLGTDCGADLYKDCTTPAPDSCNCINGFYEQNSSSSDPCDRTGQTCGYLQPPPQTCPPGYQIHADEPGCFPIPPPPCDYGQPGCYDPPTPTPTRPPVGGPPPDGGGNYCVSAGYHECTPGTSAGSCTKDGKTCTAYEVYTCNFGGKTYCGSKSCAEPCTGGGTQPPPGGGGIGNDGPGGCCNPSSPNDGAGNNCRSWERCDISNGACSTGKSCRSTTGCARDSDCGLPNNRCEGGQCKAGPPTGGCQSASSLQARFWLEGQDPGQNPGTIAAGRPVNAAVFRNNEGALAGSKVNNEYTPTDVSARISGPISQSIDVSRVNQFTPTQAGTYSLTATCGNNVTATATLTVTGGFHAADVDHNGCVGIVDFNFWRDAFKTGTVQSNTFPDMDGNGTINIIDFNIWYNAVKTLPSDKLCR